jgi:hypothetical protein
MPVIRLRKMHLSRVPPPAVSDAFQRPGKREYANAQPADGVNRTGYGEGERIVRGGCRSVQQYTGAGMQRYGFQR